MSLTTVLKQHKITDPELEEQISDLIEKAFQQGLEAGSSKQAILELAGRDRFLDILRDKIAKGVPI